MSWKEMTKDYVMNAPIESLRSILGTMNARNLFEGPRAGFKESIDKGNREAFYAFLEELAGEENYSTFLFPAIQQRESAPNFYVPGENDIASENEKWKSIYLIFSAVRVGNTLLNLDNVDDNARKHWRQKLHSENPAQFYSEVRTEFRLASRGFGPFFTSLLAYGYFIAKVRDEEVKSRKISGPYGLSEIILDLNRDYGFNRNSTLIIISGGPREKKKMYYFSSLVPLLSRWFEGFIEGRERTPAILSFVDAISATEGKATHDLAVDLREKLSYYLFRYNRVNGEVLGKLVELKVDTTLSSRGKRIKQGKAAKVYGLASAKEFFSYL